MNKKARSDPKDWTTEELFTFLIVLSIIAPNEKLSDWESSRPELIEMVREELKIMDKS